MKLESQLQVYTASGVAPFTVNRTTLVTNLNAQYLNGQLDTYYAAASSLSSYLPLAGGTLTGGLTVSTQLSVLGATATDILRLYVTGSTIWKLGVTDASGSALNISADFGSFTINKSTGTVTTPGAFVSTVVTGTAPLTVASTTLVTNLNAQYLNGQLGGYYQNAGNLNAGTLLAARLPAFTGDVSSTVGTVGLTLASVGTAGTYRSVTTDAKGRVTAGTNPTTLAGYGITDALPLAGGTLTGAITVNGVSDAVVVQTNGNAAQWYGRISVRNSTSDKSSFLGTYQGVAGVFAHNNALNAWADLYVNTVDGTNGGIVRMSADVRIGGNAALHAATTSAPSLSIGGSSARWATGRTIALTGDVTGTSVAFDGTAALSFAATLANSGATAGTYNNVTVNAKGLVTGGSNASYLTSNQSISITGDATGSGSTGIVLTLANVLVTPGTYTKVTANATGLITAGTSLTSADLPTYTGTITSGQVTTGLGFTPYNASNPSNYITASASITGNAATATNGFTFKPSWAGNQNLIAATGNLNSSLPSGFYEAFQATNSPTPTTWYNLINVRHSNTGNDHGFQLAMRYYDEVLWSRSYQGGTGANDGTFTTWRAHLHSGNFNSYALPLAGGTLTGGITATNFTGPGTGLTGNATSLTAGAVPWSGITSKPTTLAGFGITDALPLAGGTMTGALNGTTAAFSGAITQGGNQVLHAGNYTSYTLPKGGSWYGANLPGTRWGGMTSAGGEIVFGQDLPAAGQMGILIDGCYIAAENNGFWSLASSNDWTTRRGMYFDGTYLRFDYNSATAYFSNASIGGSQVLHAGNYTAYPDATKLPLAGGTLTGQVQLKAGHGDTRFQLYENYNNDTNHAQAAYLTLWASEPGLTWTGAGIGANINIGGQYYGRAGTGQAYGVYIRFDAIYGRTEFYNTTGVPGTIAGQGTLRAKIEADGEIYATASLYKVLHAGNYTSYSPPLGGTGATGVWPISITGNASGSSASAGYLTGGDSNFYGILYNNTSGNLNLYNTPGLISAEYVGTTNNPTGSQSNGHFIQISDAGGTDVKTQWYYQYSGSDISMRLMWGNGSWLPWRKLLHDGNYNSYALPLAGGTLTGSITATNHIGPGTGLTGTAPGLNIGGNANNITQYTVNQSVGTGNSPSFTGLSVINTITGAVSGSSGSCTGNAATVTNATFSRQFTVRDDRSDGNDYSLAARSTGLYAISGSGTNGPGSPWLSLIHLANANDVAFQIAGGYTSDAMYFRGTYALQNGTGYSTWRSVIHSGNIASQTVATAGSCTGNAASATTAGNVNGYGTSTGVGANTIVVRDSAGYIYGNYINTNVSESENPSVNSFFTSNGDGWIRKSTVAHVKYTLSLSGTNTGDQTNISGSSGSCTGNAASVTDGVYLSTNQSISGVKTFSSAPVATNIAKAWVYYNMNNNTIYASYNVSSVTDNGTGVCTVNFSSAMVDANYVVAGTATYGYDDQDIHAMILAVPRRSTAQQAGSCRLATEYIHAAGVYDSIAVRAVFYR